MIPTKKRNRDSSEDNLETNSSGMKRNKQTSIAPSKQTTTHNSKLEKLQRNSGRKRNKQTSIESSRQTKPPLPLNPNSRNGPSSAHELPLFSVDKRVLQPDPQAMIKSLTDRCSTLDRSFIMQQNISDTRLQTIREKSDEIKKLNTQLVATSKKLETTLAAKTKLEETFKEEVEASRAKSKVTYERLYENKLAKFEEEKQNLFAIQEEQKLKHQNELDEVRNSLKKSFVEELDKQQILFNEAKDTLVAENEAFVSSKIQEVTQQLNEDKNTQLEKQLGEFEVAKSLQLAVGERKLKALEGEKTEILSDALKTEIQFNMGFVDAEKKYNEMQAAHNEIVQAQNNTIIALKEQQKKDHDLYKNEISKTSSKWDEVVRKERFLHQAALNTAKEVLEKETAKLKGLHEVERDLNSQNIAKILSARIHEAKQKWQNEIQLHAQQELEDSKKRYKVLDNCYKMLNDDHKTNLKEVTDLRSVVYQWKAWYQNLYPTKLTDRYSGAE